MCMFGNRHNINSIHIVNSLLFESQDKIITYIYIYVHMVHIYIYRIDTSNCSHVLQILPVSNGEANHLSPLLIQSCFAWETLFQSINKNKGALRKPFAHIQILNIRPQLIRPIFQQRNFCRLSSRKIPWSHDLGGELKKSHPSDPSCVPTRYPKGDPVRIK